VDVRDPAEQESRDACVKADVGDQALDGGPLQWAKGLFVTSAGTCNGSWVIVMSKGAPFLRQVTRIPSVPGNPQLCEFEMTWLRGEEQCCFTVPSCGT
jgi:hypothetical protein